MTGKDILNLVANYRRYRVDYEPRWYMSLHAYENEHFMAWSRTRGQLVKIPFRKRLFHQLPEVTKQADALENLLLGSDPMFVPYPNDMSSDADIQAAKYWGLLLREYYNEWMAQNLFHEYVHNGLVMPYSFMEVRIIDKWDPIKKKMVKDVAPFNLDAFEVLFDPRYNFEDNNVIIKIIKKPAEDILRSSLYKGKNKRELSGDNEIDFKEIYIRDKYGTDLETGNQRPVLLYEAHIKEKDGLRIKTVDGSGFEMRNDFYEGINFHSIVPFKPFSGDMMQPSFVEKLLPMNRAEDIISNRIEDFIYKMVRGAYLRREGSEVNFDDETGSIVTYEGEKPDVMTIPQIPAFVFQWFQSMLTMTERYGVSSIMFGQQAKGSAARTNKIYESLQRQTLAQQKTPVDNFYYSLKRIAEITVYYLSTIMTEPRDFTVSESGGQFTNIQFIGEENSKLYPTAIPLPKHIKRMNVQIEDALGYTIEGKRESALKIAEIIAKVPPPFQEIILDLYRVGNTADIMQKMEKSKTLLSNPEFQNLLANRDKLPPEVKAGLATLLTYLSQQSPVPSANTLAVPGGGGAPVKPPMAGTSPDAAPAA